MWASPPPYQNILYYYCILNIIKHSLQPSATPPPQPKRVSNAYVFMCSCDSHYRDVYASVSTPSTPVNNNLLNRTHTDAQTLPAQGMPTWMGTMREDIFKELCNDVIGVPEVKKQGDGVTYANQLNSFGLHTIDMRISNA